MDGAFALMVGTGGFDKLAQELVGEANVVADRARVLRMTVRVWSKLYRKANERRSIREVKNSSARFPW